MLPPKVSLLQQLLLFFFIVCSCNIVLPALGQPALLRRNIIKVRASGFLPFESDLLLPLGILRQLQAQDRASRLLPPQQQQLRRKPKPKPKPKVKQQVRLERAKADAGIQMYNLIDDDGELLLNLRVHSETSNNNINNNHLDDLPQASRLEELATPWRPSKWRPTKRPPPALTSSSPRPLPLHQYLSSNSLDQHQQQLPVPTQQRRMLAARQDWRSYQ